MLTGSVIVVDVLAVEHPVSRKTPAMQITKIVFNVFIFTLLLFILYPKSHILSITYFADLLNIIAIKEMMMMENIRPRLPATRRRYGYETVSDDNSFVAKTLKQLAVCCVIAITVFAVSKSDAPICKSITDGISGTLSYTVDYKSASAGIWEGIKKIPGLFDEKEITPEENTDAATD